MSGTSVPLAAGGPVPWRSRRKSVDIGSRVKGVVASRQNGNALQFGSGTVGFAEHGGLIGSTVRPGWETAGHIPARVRRSLALPIDEDLPHPERSPARAWRQSGRLLRDHEGPRLCRCAGPLPSSP